jgi:hypothetical protein
MAKPKKTFKELIEGNPLTSLAVVAAAAVTTTFSVTSYFNGSEQKIRELESQHQLSTQKESLNGQIADLQGRLSSIERKLGAEGSSYLDVSGLVTTPDRAGSLGGEFKYFTDLKLYIAVPRNENWKYEITTELKLAEYLFGASLSDSTAKPGLRNLLNEMPLHLWRGPTQFEVNTNDADVPKLTLFPFVAVESFDNTQFAQLVGAALAKDEEKGAENLRTLKELSTKLDAQTDGAKSGQALPSEESRQNTTKTISETRLAITNQLSGVFRSDFAGYMLFGQLKALYAFQNSIEGTSLRLVTAEKKGNVLYAHFLVTFTDAKSKSLLFWDRECFFVSGPSHSVLLLTSAPSSDRRPAESAWITSWLGSVRIPIE